VPPAAVLSSLKISPNKFWTKGARSGTTIRYRLSRAARVTLRFDRLTSGHRKGSRCRTKGPGKRCTIVTRVGTLSLSGRTAANRQRFSGKLSGKALGLGSYRVTATTASGRSRSARFTVIRAPRAKGR
jgi:hypothetical protein